jgi:hypothetical protein
MSIIIDTPRPDTEDQNGPTPVAWAVADEGLWVANYGGSFGGTVDQHGPHFFVMDTFGRYIGDFDNLDTAQTALIDHLSLRGLLA